MGRTPLLVDEDASCPCDVYFKYRSAVQLDAKKMTLDVSMGRSTLSEALEEARLLLVRAMRHGLTLYVALGNSAPDFCGLFCDPAFFPRAVFDRAAVTALCDHAAGLDLNGSEDPFALALRPSDCRQADTFCVNAGFEVIVCSHFKLEDFESFLCGRLPMELLQPIAPITLH